MNDKTIGCKDCEMLFVFSKRDQEFFAEKGFTNEPQRCRDCRLIRRAQSGRTEALARPSFEAVCAACNITTTLPFLPRGDRPVYCRTCFDAKVPATV